MAVRLGVIDPEVVILRGLTAKKFKRWQHYASLEPFDEIRADYRAASIVAATFNVNRGKGQRAMTLDEARVKFGPKEKGSEQTPQQQLAMLRLLAAAYSGDEGPRATGDPDAEVTADMRDQVRRARAAMKEQ
jgi:hypothetical protein